DKVKNALTPRKPPRIQLNCAWNSRTANTATPRSPSSAGRYCNCAARSLLSRWVVAKVPSGPASPVRLHTKNGRAGGPDTQLRAVQPPRAEHFDRLFGFGRRPVDAWGMR